MRYILVFVLILIISLLFFFYLTPFNNLDFTAKTNNNNFSIIPGENNMQFYHNMRFPSPIISYKILNCPFSKQNNMEYAFDVMESMTPLRFYPVNETEQILITCEERMKVDEGLFIAGEGGPTNITATEEFSVIFGGEILLLKESKCPIPNIALHELFHVLGFNHSSNPANIMYHLSKCEQEISGDMIKLINQLYSVPNYPDLKIENASATITSKFLNLNATISNVGLGDAEAFNLSIYSDGEIIKEIIMDSIKIGYGNFINIKNIWISKADVSELELIIKTNFTEINKENNNIKLEIKK